MQERNQPGEIAQAAIASITMISREAIRAINGVAVEASPAPVMGEYADKVFGSGQQSTQEPSGADPTSASAALAVTGAGSVSIQEQPQPSDSEQTQETAEFDGEGIAGAPMSNMSPNDRVRFMQGQGAAAPAPTAPTPNEIISGLTAGTDPTQAGSSQAETGEAPGETQISPENAIGEQVETGQGQE